MESKSNIKSDNDDFINYYDFNEDGSCISIGTQIGFKIVTCDPFSNFHYRKFGRGIGIVEMYHSSNIIALTGCGENSKFPENKLIIWDDNKGEIIKELRISSKIRVIKIIKNILFIVNDIKIYILNFENLSLINSYEIYVSEKELISFSVNKNINIAYVSKKKKIIYIENIEKNKNFKIKMNDKDKDNDLKYTYLQFNSKGDIIAGAMIGKVYLYNSSNGEQIREIKNDILKNEINCISFSDNGKYLIISTIEKNAGTINIFDIKSKKETSFFDYFLDSGDKCFAYYKITSEGFIFRIYKDDKIIIITSKGEFYKININKNGGYCKKQDFKKIFE